jgi:hypothetical protein
VAAYSPGVEVRTTRDGGVQIMRKAGEGTRLFDGVPRSYQLDLISSTASRSGIVELQYRRHR